MLALITLETWEVVAALALIITLLTALRLHARHWSVKRLVMVCVYYKDGTRKDFIAFTWQIKKLYAAIEGNPRIPGRCSYYGPDGTIEINGAVKQITLRRFRAYPWSNLDSLLIGFQWEETLWDSRHTLLVNVLKDLGLEDDQSMDPKILNLLSYRCLDTAHMVFALINPSSSCQLTDSEVTYLERLSKCLRVADTKKWTRENRYERFNGKLPGTEELVMKLLATDEGAKKVIAAINRGWQPEPVQTPAEYRCTPQD